MNKQLLGADLWYIQIGDYVYQDGYIGTEPTCLSDLYLSKESAQEIVDTLTMFNDVEIKSFNINNSSYSTRLYVELDEKFPNSDRGQGRTK